MKASDKKQFLAQYEEIHESLMRFCIVKSRGIMDPKDLANDVLLVGLENYHKLEDKSALLSYLFTTASRICLNKMRRRKFNGHYEEDEAEKLEDPINNVDSRVDISLLYAALNELPELQREAVVLFEISDLPIKEIMVIQNAGASAVKQRIKRGREKLVELMREKPQKKTAVIATILFTSNSFSMSHLDAYFQVIKEMPLPLSSSEVTAAVGNFQLAGSAANTAASKIGSAILKKTIIASTIVATVVGASVLLSNNDDPVLNETIIAIETPSDSVFIEPKQNEITKTVKYADVTSSPRQELYIIDDLNNETLEFDEPETVSPIENNTNSVPKLTSNYIADKKPTPTFLEGDSYPSASVNTVYLKNLGDYVEVRTWEKDEIKIISEHKIEGKTPEDTKTIEKNIKHKVEKTGGTLTLANNTCMEAKQKVRSGKKSTGVISFGNGDKAKFKTLELHYVVMLPKSVNLKISGHYKKMIVPAMDGNLTARLHDTHLTVGAIGGDSELNLNYSNAVMDKFAALSLNLIDSKISFKSANELALNARYSTITAKTISNTTLTLFDSHLKAESADKKLNGNVRYSTIDFENSVIDKSKLKAFDSKLSIPTIAELNIELRYSTLTSQKIGSLYIPVSFDSKVNIQKVNDLKGVSSKYTTYQIDELTNTISLHSYDDKLTLLNTQLASMTFEGRYTTYAIKLASPANYDFDFDGNHGNLDYGKLALTTEAYETKNDHQIINGYFEAGGNENARIKFKCYDSNIQLK
jgi:RNA polymerase sigma-70 factor (ECF subfamily)